jgi:hypothetical protein
MKKQILLYIFLFSFVCLLNAQVSKNAKVQKETVATETTQQVTAITETIKSSQNTTAVTSYDFTTGDGSQFYGGASAAKQMSDGKWAMIAGDADGNGQIQNSDSEDIWKPANGTSGYSNADFNLNGQVQNNDREDYWKVNNGRGSQVPN